MKRWNKRDSAFGIVALIVFCIDQAVKWLVLSREVVSGSSDFRIGTFWNEGIAFSIRIQGVWMSLLIVAALLFVLFVYLHELKKFPRQSAWACGLVIGGAASNILDRLRFGRVLDYILVADTSMFNLADVCVVIGLAWILILSYRDKRQLE